MPGSGIVVIGASAGGVETLKKIVAMLPPTIHAALCIVLHISPTGLSVLPEILQRAGSLPAHHPHGNLPLECGHIYVAPPDHHLVVDHGLVRISKGPRENGHRPSINVLFRSAAVAYGRQVIGIVLSGNLDDGTRGLVEIKARGGIAIVQDPGDADYPGMPLSAIRNVKVDHIAKADEIVGIVLHLLETIGGKEVCDPDPGEVIDMERVEEGGHPSVFSCPDCGGVLIEFEHQGVLRYRCRVGHAWSPESLRAGFTVWLGTLDPDREE